MANDIQDTSRRRFLNWFLGTSSGALLASIFYPVLRFISPPEVPEASTNQVEAGATIEGARTVAVNTLVMFEIFYLLSSRYEWAPVLNREGLFGNRYVLWAIGLVLFFQLLFTYTAPMQFLFRTEALGAVTWLRIAVVGASVLFIVEAEKWLVRRLFHDNGLSTVSR